MGRRLISKYYACLLVLLTLLSLDQALAEVVTVDEDFSTRLLGLDFEMYEDQTGLLDFDAVQHQVFKPNRFLVPAFGYTKSTYWYRFELQNATDQERRLYVELAIAWIDQFSLFMQRDQKWMRYDAGAATRLRDRSAQNNLPTHRIDLPARSLKTIYLRIASSDTIVLPIHLHADAYFAAHIRVKDLLYGLFAGIMAVAAFYGLSFYVYTFNQAYLYYCLNTLSWLAMFAAWDGYGKEFIFHDDFWWNKRFNVLVMASALSFGALFTLKILEIPSYSKLLTRIVWGWTAVHVTLFALVFVLPYPIMMQTASNIALGFPVLLCVTSLTALRHRMKIARYYIASWVFPVIGVVIFNGMVVGLIPGSPLFVYALHFGILLQSLFLSFTLSYHLREATRNASVLKVSVEAAGLAHSALMQNELDPGIFQLAYRYRPCEESGGDVFSCLQDPRGHFSYIVVGDISGHGITAAIISSAFTGALNATVKGLLASERDLEASCKKIMNDLNQVMCDYFARTNHFASAVLVGIDQRDGQAIYINAGHRNIFLKSAAKVSTLLRGGSLMGFHPDSHLVAVPLHLAVHDMLLFFTDGLVENDIGRSQKTRLDLLMKSLASQEDPQGVLDLIWQSIAPGRDVHYADDMTLLVLKLTSLPASAPRTDQASA